MKQAPAPIRDIAISAVLFAATAILWGSSAIVTGHQAISGAPEVSVGYRMTLVFLTMLFWCRITGQRITIARSNWPWILAQGVLFFALAFVTFYYATTLIPSGIAALILSTSTLFAALVGWLGFDQQITLRMIIGALFGMAGLGIISAGQLISLGMERDTLWGLTLALAAAACTGAGTVVAMRNQKAGLPTAVLICWAAFVGAMLCFSLAISRGLSFRVELTPTYIAGLAYLAIAASCLTFFMYFRLVQRIGPTRAAYTLALVPIVAILLSVLFEGLAFDLIIAAGTVAVLAGNVIVLGRSPERPQNRNPIKETA